MIGNGVEREVPDEVDRARQRAADAEAQTPREEHDGLGPPHPLAGLFSQVRELVDHANLYVETRKDVLRGAVRRAAWAAVLGAVGGLAGATIIIVAAVYLMSGIAHGLGTWLGDEFWLGELITGLAVLLVLAGAAFFMIKRTNRKARERTIEKYERRQQQQRERFGHSATDRAQQIRQSH